MSQQQIIQLAWYGLVFFCILIGSLVGSVTTETLKTMPPAKRYLIQLGGFMLVGLWMGYLLSLDFFNYFLLGVIGFFLGLGSVKMVMWLVDMWQKSENYEEFFKRLTRALKAGRDAYNDVKPPVP